MKTIYRRIEINIEELYNRFDSFITLHQQSNKGHIKESNKHLAKTLQEKHGTTGKHTKSYHERQANQVHLLLSPSPSISFQKGGKLTKGTISNTVGMIASSKQGSS